jgi:hypothetical protein
MPLFLLVVLGVLALVAVWLLLLPISLWARYASGRARRRAQHWVIRGNAWLLAFSLPLFLLSAWLASRWMHAALRDAVLGLLLGALVGIASLWLTRFERDAKGLIYTPNRWLVLALTTLVALRVAAGFWMAWRHATGDGVDALTDAIDAGAWTGVAGLFLGYALAYAWGLRARLSRIARP